MFISAPKSTLNPQAKEFKPSSRQDNLKTIYLLVFDLLLEHLLDVKCSFIDEVTGAYTVAPTMDPAERRQILANLCLVRRSWLGPARDALHRSVVLRSEAGIQQILDAEPMHPVIKELWIVPYSEYASRGARLVQVYKSIYGEKTWRTHFERDSAQGSGDSSASYDPYPYGRQKLTQCLLMRVKDLRHLCIEIGGYGGYGNPNGLEPMLHAISLMFRLESLVLTSSGVCTEPDKPRYSYPYFIPLCGTISKLRSLKYLHISHWSCLSTQIMDGLTAELTNCTPPTSLKTIIMEVIDEPLPVHYVSWLLRPREEYAPVNYMLKAAEVCRDQFLSAVFAGSNLSSILRLNIDSKLAIASNVQDLVTAGPSVTHLHLNFTIPGHNFSLPVGVVELRFRFFKLRHSECRRMDKVLAAFLSAYTQMQPHSCLRSIVVELEYENDRKWEADGLSNRFPMTVTLCHRHKILFLSGQAWHGNEGVAVAAWVNAVC